MTAAVTPAALTVAGYPVESIAFAPTVISREIAETLALLPEPHRCALVALWEREAGAVYIPPADPATSAANWGPHEGELTMFGVTAFGETKAAAIAQWIELVRRIDTHMDREDAA